jgi:hypothetical protein
LLSLQSTRPELGATWLLVHGRSRMRNRRAQRGSKPNRPMMLYYLMWDYFYFGIGQSGIIRFRDFEILLCQLLLNFYYTLYPQLYLRIYHAQPKLTALAPAAADSTVKVLDTVPSVNHNHSRRSRGKTAITSQTPRLDFTIIAHSLSSRVQAIIITIRDSAAIARRLSHPPIVRTICNCNGCQRGDKRALSGTRQFLAGSLRVRASDHGLSFLTDRGGQVWGDGICWPGRLLRYRPRAGRRDPRRGEG